jgi:hypothetical protein
LAAGRAVQKLEVDPWPAPSILKYFLKAIKVEDVFALELDCRHLANTRGHTDVAPIVFSLAQGQGFTFTYTFGLQARNASVVHMANAEVLAFKFLWTALLDQDLAFFHLTHSFKSWIGMVVRLLEFHSTESTVISPFPLLPLLASKPTMIRLRFTLLAKILATLITSNSLHRIMSCCLFTH